MSLNFSIELRTLAMINQTLRGGARISSSPLTLKRSEAG
jgi:hypothetical protein